MAKRSSKKSQQMIIPLIIGAVVVAGLAIAMMMATTKQDNRSDASTGVIVNPTLPSARPSPTPVTYNLQCYRKSGTTCAMYTVTSNTTICGATVGAYSNVCDCLRANGLQLQSNCPGYVPPQGAGAPTTVKSGVKLYK